jgi:hypothetical protein
MVYVSASLMLGAFALLTYPLWALGSEQFDLEQELGILFLPFGLVTMLVGLTAIDPLTTTIGGTFGNPEFDTATRITAPGGARRGLDYDPREPVNCRQCRSVIPAEYAQCRRCARARPCRSCGRPLGVVLDRPTCPACGQAEPLCNCAGIVRASSLTPHERVRARR